MTDVINTSEFVHKEYKWNTLDIKVFYQGMLSFPSEESQMLYFIPALVVDSCFYVVLVLVDTYSNNSDFALPFLFIF